MRTGCELGPVRSVVSVRVVRVVPGKERRTVVEKRAGRHAAAATMTRRDEWSGVNSGRRVVTGFDLAVDVERNPTRFKFEAKRASAPPTARGPFTAIDAPAPRVSAI